MVPQLLQLNHEHPGQRGVPHSGTLSSRICCPFPENTPQAKSEARAGPEKAWLLWLSQPSSTMPHRLFQHRTTQQLPPNNSGTADRAPRRNPMCHQLISNFNLPSPIFFFSRAAKKQKSRKATAFTYTAVLRLWYVDKWYEGGKRGALNWNELDLGIATAGRHNLNTTTASAGKTGFKIQA